MRYVDTGKDCVVDFDRQERIVEQLQATERLGGACVEVGAYRGGTAELISRYKATRPLYLFDTFEGIPFVDERDISQDGFIHKVGDFSDTSLELVKARLSDYEDVHVYKGIFPQDTGNIIENLEFSFVHLDVDVYQSYMDSLKFFYPRMLGGGVIICDDYSFQSTYGARRAVDKFFKDKPEDYSVPFKEDVLGAINWSLNLIINILPKE